MLGVYGLFMKNVILSYTVLQSASKTFFWMDGMNISINYNIQQPSWV